MLYYSALFPLTDFPDQNSLKATVLTAYADVNDDFYFSYCFLRIKVELKSK